MNVALSCFVIHPKELVILTRKVEYTLRLAIKCLSQTNIVAK